MVLVSIALQKGRGALWEVNFVGWWVFVVVVVVVDDDDDVRGY